jgi:hypothetical protein
MDMAHAVGCDATLSTKEGLDVRVRVLDARSAWGDIHVKVRALTGAREVWVSAQRVALVAESMEGSVRT